MAKLEYKIKMKVDMEPMLAAIKKAGMAYNEFTEAVEEINRLEINMFTVDEPTPKWWQFWKR